VRIASGGAAVAALGSGVALFSADRRMRQAEARGNNKSCHSGSRKPCCTSNQDHRHAASADVSRSNPAVDDLCNNGRSCRRELRGLLREVLPNLCIQRPVHSKLSCAMRGQQEISEEVNSSRVLKNFEGKRTLETCLYSLLPKWCSSDHPRGVPAAFC